MLIVELLVKNVKSVYMFTILTSHRNEIIIKGRTFKSNEI